MNGFANGCKFNKSHYTTKILSPLSEWRSVEVQGSNGKLIVHTDNAPLHTRRATIDFVEQNRMRRILHSPYSPDLAPSDFYLFGYVKGCETGLTFEDADSLFGNVRQILKDILEWMERLKKCIATNGDYIE
jgi:histone-lysine N-methyltransferase SETMAR